MPPSLEDVPNGKINSAEGHILQGALAVAKEASLGTKSKQYTKSYLSLVTKKLEIRRICKISRNVTNST